MAIGEIGESGYGGRLVAKELRVGSVLEVGISRLFPFRFLSLPRHTRRFCHASRCIASFRSRLL